MVLILCMFSVMVHSYRKKFIQMISYTNIFEYLIINYMLTILLHKSQNIIPLNNNKLLILAFASPIDCTTITFVY